MIRKEKNGLVWFEFELLQKYPQVLHGVFAYCNNMDSVKNIFYKNSEIPLISARQIHKTNIHVIKNRPIHDMEVLDTDILVTDQIDVMLMIRHADCQAAIIYDIKNNVLGLVHAGWKGQVQNIYKKTIDYFVEKYNSSTEEILVLISPSLGPDYSEFINYRTEFPVEFYKYQKENDLFDLWQIAYDQLIACNILDKNIEIARMCTFSEEKLFHSYRRNKTQKRNATCAVLT